LKRANKRAARSAEADQPDDSQSQSAPGRKEIVAFEATLPHSGDWIKGNADGEAKLMLIVPSRTGALLLAKTEDLAEKTFVVRIEEA